MANAFSGERKRGHVKWVSSRENILTACMHYPPRATPTTFARTGLGTHLAQLGMERGTSSTPRATSWPGDTHCPLGAAELQLHPPRCAFWGWGMLDVLWGQGVMAQSCPCTWQFAAAGIFFYLLSVTFYQPSVPPVMPEMTNYFKPEAIQIPQGFSLNPQLLRRLHTTLLARNPPSLTHEVPSSTFSGFSG